MSVIQTFPAKNIRTERTRTMPVIGEIHHFIHVGAVFDLTKKLVIPASATIYVVGVPNGGSVHFHKESYTGSTGGFEVRLLEGVSFTGGDQLTGQNRNRRLNNLSTFGIFANPNTIDISQAEELYIIGVPTTTQPAFRSPSTGSETDEWILAEGLNYAVEIKNLTTNPLTLYIEFSWYETALLT
jgi:hypothetical protein